VDWSSAHILHGTGITIAGHSFFGVSGGIPVTPFGSWSYDFTEEQARSLLADCPTGCVLVTHSPPNGVVDAASNGASLGSMAIHEAVEVKHPKLVVCGHIHASAGKQAMIGSTYVINAGPAGVIWNIH
jgi:Icc-related predicted phosphoesterase